MHPSIPADSEAAADTPPVHASGSCWRSLAQREQARLQLVHSRPAAAHDHPERHDDTDPGIHTGDSLAERMQHHLQTAYRAGRSHGERAGYTQGMWFGVLCGVAWTLAVIGAVVLVIAATDSANSVQLISRVTT